MSADHRERIMDLQNIVRWLTRTPVQTFVLCPLVVMAFEFAWRGGTLAFEPASLLIGLTLMLWGFLQYKLVGRYRGPRAGGGPGMETMPNRILDQGPYRLTRNPMYLGHIIFLIGLAIAFRSWFALIILAARAAWFHMRVLHDEARLQAAFGAEYDAYRARVKRWIPGVLSALLAASVPWPGAHAQPASAPFPAGKPVSVHVGVAPGGGNDRVMRLVARNIGKYLPGQPNVVARNTPGAGGRRLAGFLFNAAPRDGTELGLLHRGLTTDPLLVDSTLPFKIAELTWIGSPTPTTDTCIVWHSAPVQSVADLKSRELVIAGSGNEAAQVHILARLTRGKIRTVIGYPGGTAMNLAMERGEAGGRCSYSWEAIKAAIPQWVADKKVKPIVQFALQRHPELPDVPLITEFAETELDRQALRVLLTPQVFGFPFAAPPGLLPQVRDILRAAFVRTMQDPQVREEAKKIRLELAPVSGEALERAAREAYSASPAAVARAKELIAPR
jgi:protein-S-isoprenylcysteine O-methyltransferase Ste14/tripartite-type tricarboxylate transporter receptor subunit TctC